METFLTLYSIIGTTSSLVQFIPTFKSLLGLSQDYEDILFDAMRSAIEEVTGEDVSKFHLKNEIYIYQYALSLLSSNLNQVELTKFQALINADNPTLGFIKSKFINILISKSDPKINTLLSFSILDLLQNSIIRLSEIESKIDEVKATNQKKLDDIFEIVKSILPSQDVRPDLQVDSNYHSQDLLKIPHNFITRTDSIDDLKYLLEQKSILFIYGITRSGKSFLVSDLVSQEFANSYYYIDFKLVGSSGFTFFLADIVSFIASKQDQSFIPSLSESGLQNPQLIAEYISKFLNTFDKYIFIFDNVHQLNNIDSLGHILSLLISSAKTSTKFILISEEKEIITTSSSIMNDYLEYRSDGFSRLEMINYFLSHNIKIDSISESFLDLIHYQSGGHPDILDGIINEILGSNNNSLNNSQLVHKVLDGFKDLPANLKITKVLTYKINSRILLTEEELKLFGRLSCLMGSFTEEMAEITAQIPPSITNFAIKFHKIKFQLLDFESGNRYILPRLIKNVADQYLTEEEKRNIRYSIAIFLSQPNNKVINSNDGLLACDYFLISDHFSEALNLAIQLVGFAISEIGKLPYIKSILDRVYGILGIKPKDDVLNEYISFCMLLLEAYKRIGDTEKQKSISFQLEEFLDHPNVKPGLKSMAASSVALYYLMDNFNLELLFKNVKIFIQNFDSSDIPAEIKSKIQNANYLENIFYYVGYKSDSSTGDLLKMLELYLSIGQKLEFIFTPRLLSDYLDVLYNRLYKQIKSNKLGLQECIQSLDRMINIFEKSNFILPIRDINYLIGLLKIDLSTNSLDSIPFFEKADDLHITNKLIDNNFVFKNFLAMADAYFRSNIFDSALDNYIKASVHITKDSSTEILALHNYIRISICHFKSKDIKKAEICFWQSVKWACSTKTHRKNNIFTAFSELSTFYILVNRPLKTIQCLSILFELLEDKPFSPKHQLISQTIGYLRHTKDKTIEKHKDVLEVNGKVFAKPYWGFYIRDFNYTDERATKSTLLYMIANTFIMYGSKFKAITYYKRAIDHEIENDFDYGSKFLSLTELIPLIIERNDFSTLPDYIVRGLTVIDEYIKSDIKIGGFEMSDVDYFMNIIINPIQNGLIRKFDNRIYFNTVEELLINLQKLIEDLDTDIGRKFNCEVSSNLAYLYFYNSDLDKAFLIKSKNQIILSSSAAITFEIYHTYINNKILELFWLQSSFSSLNDFFKELFGLCYYILKYSKDDSIQISQFNNRFEFLIKNIKKQTALRESEKKIFEVFNNALENSSLCNATEAEKLIFILAGFIELRLTVGLSNDLLQDAYNYLPTKITNNHSGLFKMVVDNYYSIIKKNCLKILSDKNKLNILLKESIFNLHTLKDQAGKLLLYDVISIIEKITTEFDDLYIK